MFRRCRPILKRRTRGKAIDIVHPKPRNTHKKITRTENNTPCKNLCCEGCYVTLLIKNAELRTLTTIPTA